MPPKKGKGGAAGGGEPPKEGGGGGKKGKGGGGDRAGTGEPSRKPGPGSTTTPIREENPPLQPTRAETSRWKAPVSQPQPQPAPIQAAQKAVAALSISEPKPSTAAPPAPAPQPALSSAPPPTSTDEYVVPLVLPSTQLSVSRFAQAALARPGYGKLGNPVTIRANHFLVKVQGSLDQITIYHYDLAVNPALTNKGVLRSLVRQLITDYQKDLGGNARSPILPVYDGAKNLYSVNQLPFTEKSFRIELLNKEEVGAPPAGPSELPEKKRREFRVTIKLVQHYNANELGLYLQGRQLHIPQEVIQAMDIAFQQKPMHLYTPVGRSFFSQQFGESPLGGDLIGWRGFYQSLRPTQQGLSLNVDVSSTAFHEEVPVMKYVTNLLGKRLDGRSRLSSIERMKVKKALYGLKVTVTHRNTNRRYRIGGLSKESLGEIRFQMDDGGKEVTIVDYFKKTYNVNLQFPGLPSLVIGQKTHLPMEVCVIAKGQRFNGKLNETQVTALLRSTCKKPHERQADIQSMVGQNNYARDEYAKQFGFVVSNEMTQVRGRVLPAPALTYAGNTTFKPSGGAWNMMAGYRFVEGKPIQHWTLINFGRVPPPVIADFVAGLSKRCTELGVSMNPTTAVPPTNGRLDNVEDSLRKVIQSARQKIPANQWLQLLVIVLPEKTSYYNDIKRICDTVLNVPTQCCLQKHVFKNQSQYLANLAMKINVKLGGRNVLLYDESVRRLPFISERPTMIIGADVTHPSPGDDSAPSIAAVVGSMDWPQANRYYCLLEAQRHRQEIIEGLHRQSKGSKGEIIASGMVRKLLFRFFKSTGQKPERIIVFRDGVSEGQFYQVLHFELTAIKRACMLMDATGTYSPTVTFVIVQKRHHTRLFPTDRNTDRSGNVQPGTCVDTAICHPREFDFYLNSHAGIQGTSRPTKYHVLFDENKFTADGIQSLCYSLCHTYARCTRTVSLVPPAYYADLAAFRASLYLNSLTNSASGSETSSQTGSFGASTSARVVPLPEVMEIPNMGMFFC